LKTSFVILIEIKKENIYFILRGILVDVTRKYKQSQQSSSTLPFGWDNVADAKMLGDIAVSSFNQVGRT